MRAVVQRVREARVGVDGTVAGEIGPGLCVLLGVATWDGEEEAVRLAGRVARLRIFENDEGRFDRSVLDTRVRRLPRRLRCHAPATASIRTLPARRSPGRA